MSKTNIYTWIYTSFDQLNTSQLYQIMHLRSEVFVVEQNCHYQDLDFKDQKAIHLQCYFNNELIAYCRLFNKADYYKDAAAIGRVLVSKPYRKQTLGHSLIDKSIHLCKDLFGESELLISAQLYLKKFYEYHGFIAEGDSYLDAGIAHIQMRKEK